MSQKKKERTPLNLLTLRPTRNLEWEIAESGRVELHVPKFSGRFMTRWLVPLFGKKTFRLKLDDYGSFVWQACDGRTTVEEIGVQMKEKFGNAVEPVYERIGRFIQSLDHSEFIRVHGDQSIG